MFKHVIALLFILNQFEFFDDLMTLFSSSQLYNIFMTQREKKFMRNFITQSIVKKRQKRRNHIDDNEKREFNKRIKK